MVSFVYGDCWICNTHAKLLLLSVSVIEKPSITAVSKFFLILEWTLAQEYYFFYYVHTKEVPVNW